MVIFENDQSLASGRIWSISYIRLVNFVMKREIGPNGIAREIGD